MQYATRRYYFSFLIDEDFSRPQLIIFWKKPSCLARTELLLTEKRALNNVCISPVIGNVITRRSGKTLNRIYLERDTRLSNRVAIVTKNENIVKKNISKVCYLFPQPRQPLQNMTYVAVSFVAIARLNKICRQER